jgi:acyl-coenzyme A thioesterase PaaI-like protein
MSAETSAEPGSRPRRRYPHPRSILCYSRIVHELHEDGTVSATMPVLPDGLDAGGRMRMGAIAPLVDLSAGLLGARAVHPDWTATLDFKLHLDQPPSGGSIHGLCRPLRVGRNMVLSENRLTDDDGRQVGVAHVTFSRLPRRTDTAETAMAKIGVTDLTKADEEPRLPLDEYYQLRFEPDEAAFELDHHERFYNSFGSIQGGAMAALLERAATWCAERQLHRPTRTVDMHFSYLAPATTGPFRVTAVPLRIDAASVLSHVELRDRGNEGRQCVVGTALAVTID